MVAMASNAEMSLLLTLGKKITNNIADDEWKQDLWLAQEANDTSTVYEPSEWGPLVTNNWYNGFVTRGGSMLKY